MLAQLLGAIFGALIEASPRLQEIRHMPSHFLTSTRSLHPLSYDGRT